MAVHRTLLKPAEVAGIFGVTPQTVKRWARAGRVRSVRTEDGHLRFDADEVDAVLAQIIAREDPTSSSASLATADAEGRSCR